MSALTAVLITLLSLAVVGIVVWLFVWAWNRYPQNVGQVLAETYDEWDGRDPRQPGQKRKLRVRGNVRGLRVSIEEEWSNNTP